MEVANKENNSEVVLRGKKRMAEYNRESDQKSESKSVGKKIFNNIVR